jgi:glycosyltransferase involved in cell wall biosynthesis
MGARGRRLVEREYNWTRVAERTVEVCRRTIARRAARSAEPADDGRVRLGLLVTTLEPAGAERVVRDLALGLDARRFSVRVASLQPLRDVTLARELRAAGIPVVSLNLASPLDLPGALRRLVGWLRRERITLLHTHMFHANLLGRLAARLARPGGVPVVATVHIAEARPLAWRFRLDRWTRRLLARETCVSSAVAEFHARTTGAARDALTVIPNGVDLARFAPDEVARREVRAEFGASEDAPLVGTVGRLDPQKDHALLLTAFAELARTNPAARLVLVGDGPLAGELAATAARLGLAERVIFTGRRADVPRLLAALDVFALSSRYEGLPLALLEAMAAEKPIVAVDLPVAREVLGEGEGAAGLVVARTAAALAAGLGRLLDDRELAARLGAAARARCAESYSVARMVARYAELYAEVLAGRHAARAVAPVSSATQ